MANMPVGGRPGPGPHPGMPGNMQQGNVPPGAIGPNNMNMAMGKLTDCSPIMGCSAKIQVVFLHYVGRNAQRTMESYDTSPSIPSKNYA